jgi:hypothetical protein
VQATNSQHLFEGAIKMPTENSGKARGTIIKVPDASPGLLFVSGEQKSFTLGGVWQCPTAPAPNMIVDVQLDASNSVVAITPVDHSQARKEQLSHASAVAQEQGKHAAELAKKGFGTLVAKMGIIALAATVLLWISWFFLPAVTMAPVLSLTFWDLLGFDFSNMMGLMMNGGTSHGFFAFLGVLCIAAPFAAPFWKHPYSRYLNVVPLAFLVIATAKIMWSVHDATSGMPAGVDSPFSCGAGTYLLALSALALAALALKKPATA